MTETSDGSCLESHRIQALPPSFYYIANFISAEEESQIVANVLPAKYSVREEFSLSSIHQIPPNRWITLSHRRLQTHPSKLTANNTLLSAPLPPFLSNPFLARFKTLGVFEKTPHGAPNHVLLNEYRPGEGIMMHEDGAAYAPVVATISLGGSVVLDLVEKKDMMQVSHSNDSTEDENGDQEVMKAVGEVAKYRILQEPRSLLITTGNGYTDFLHGIARFDRDENLEPDTVVNWNLLGNPEQFKNGINERVTRTSLTYRDVLKVSHVGNKILGFGKR